MPVVLEGKKNPAIYGKMYSQSIVFVHQACRNHVVCEYIYLLGRCVCFAGVQQPVCGPHHVRPAHVLGQNFHAAQEAGDHSGPQSAAR